jgi:hypothetical protein
VSRDEAGCHLCRCILDEGCAVGEVVAWL